MEHEDLELIVSQHVRRLRTGVQIGKHAPQTHFKILKFNVYEYRIFFSQIELQPFGQIYVWNNNYRRLKEVFFPSDLIQKYIRKLIR